MIDVTPRRTGLKALALPAPIEPVTGSVEDAVHDAARAAFRPHLLRRHLRVRCGDVLIAPTVLFGPFPVAIEVDGHGDAFGEATNRYRQDMLTAAGWTTIRLRLAGLAPIGERDVCVPVPWVGPDALAMLMSAVEDAFGSVVPVVRHVQLGRQRA